MDVLYLWDLTVCSSGRREIQRVSQRAVAQMSKEIEVLYIGTGEGQ
jgi:hypothetical protein